MTIDQLTSEQLKNPDIFEKIKELSDSFVLHVQAKEAYQLQEKLTSLLESSDLAEFQPELYKKYQNLIAQLKWTASSIIPDEEFLKLLKENYLNALKNEDIDAQDRIEVKMFSIGLFPRNELRQKIYKIVKENEEKLGPRTIGGWIIDYSKTFDFRERTKTTHLDYIFKSPEAQALSEKEKNILREILWTLDNLLIVTPVMSEPLFSEAYKIITGIGIVRKPIPFPKPAAAPLTPEIKKIPEPIVPKEKKPGFFTRLFGKPAPPKPEIAKEEKPVSPYEKKISPYEIKREIPKKPVTIGSILTRPIFTIDIPRPKPPKAEEIQTFPEMAKSEMTKIEPERKKPPLPAPQYQIRTMKGDIEKVKKQPIPQKPEPKIKNNIVDLSGK